MPDRIAAASVAPGGWIVLGLLVQEAPQSGYDLASRAARSIAHFWPITKAQVYAELPRLEAAGHLVSEDIVQSGAPDKRVYRPTATGRAAFTRWLADVRLGDVKLRHPLLLKLWFGTESQTSRLLEACEQHRATLLAQRDRFDTLLTRLAAKSTASARGRLSAAHRQLALRHGVLRLEAELAWLDEVQDDLNRT